ncbi:MAG: hypothetical protein D6706_15075 [Chloroflexi bacterium]|nr:MAG: hypothetical protein D6706_15075 [Chloroflexota bacterium]
MYEVNFGSDKIMSTSVFPFEIQLFAGDNGELVTVFDNTYTRHLSEKLIVDLYNHGGVRKIEGEFVVVEIYDGQESTLRSCVQNVNAVGDEVYVITDQDTLSYLANILGELY